MNFGNGLKYAFRTLKANRACSVISIIGLGLSFVCVVVIAEFIFQEYRTDRFHRNYDRIYYCVSRSSELSRPRMADIINWSKQITDYPEVEAATNLHLHPQGEIKYNQRSFYADILTVDTNISDIFDFSEVTGELKTALTDPLNIVLTRHLAEKLFGDADPFGKELEYFGLVYKVAGIVEDWPQNSSFTFDALIHTRPGFGRMGVHFITLKPGCRIEEVNTKLVSEVFRGIQEFQYEFLPFRDLYFATEVDKDVISSSKTGDARSLWILGAVGLSILIIGLFNYVNIYNVALLGRGQELGVKKVFGGSNRRLFAGFWRENLIMVTLAVVMGAFLLFVCSTWIGRLTGLSIQTGTFFDIGLWTGMIVLLPLVVSIWPFLKYRRIHPALAVKDRVAGKKNSSSRRILLGLQYVVTIVMLIVSFYFIRQLNFMLGQDIGLRQRNIIHAVFFREKELYIDWRNPEAREEAKKQHLQMEEEHRKNVQYLQNELSKFPYIQSVCVGNSPFNIWMSPWKRPGSDIDYQSCASFAVTPGFEQLYGLRLKEGRFFNRNQDRDRQYKVVINEAARRFFNIQAGEDVWLANNYWGGEEQPWQVIGIVEDFHFEHLTKAVQPLVMYFFDDNEDVPYMMHLTEGKEKEALAFLQQLYQKVNPEGEFTYRFFEEEVQALYRKDKKMVQLVTVFTFLAVIISSMGLFGFLLYESRQRYKEIGIRKVNGASSLEVMVLLMRQFFMLIFIAFIIAAPVAWVIVEKYTENFAEKAEFSWWLFGLAAFLTGLVAFITMCSQSYKAATVNPVESLKGE